MTQPPDLTLAEAREALRAKKLSSAELTRAYLEAIDKAKVISVALEKEQVAVLAERLSALLNELVRRLGAGALAGSAWSSRHGGTITVESEPGAYTEFTVRLPRQ